MPYTDESGKVIGVKYRKRNNDWNTHGNPVNILLEISFHVERINIVCFCIEGITPAVAVGSKARGWEEAKRANRNTGYLGIYVVEITHYRSEYAHFI